MSTGKNESERRVVLLVDDDLDYLAQQKLLLERAGHEVITAESAAEAERLLEETCPDLLIVDLMMETDDAGFVLCHHVRRKHPDLPIILVTAVTAETGFEFSLGGQEDGGWVKADAILAKPIRYEQLRREMERLLK